MTGPCGIHPGVAGEPTRRKAVGGDEHLPEDCPKRGGRLFSCGDCGAYNDCPQSPANARKVEAGEA